MKARITQSSRWELILGIGLVVVQLCAWPTENTRSTLQDNIPDVLKIEQGHASQRRPQQSYPDSTAASRLLTASFSTVKES